MKYCLGFPKSGIQGCTNNRGLNIGKGNRSCPCVLKYMEKSHSFRAVKEYKDIYYRIDIRKRYGYYI